MARREFPGRRAPASDPDWLTLGQAAKYLGVAQSTIRKWSDHGRVPAFYTPGGHRRYRRADLDKFLESSGPGAREHAGPTVLVVDDDDRMREYMRASLELEGYTVLEADRLEEARRHLRAGPVSVVLLDVHVGTEDGRELLAEIHAEWPSTRIALFSGTSGYAGVVTAGADAVIPKPFTLDHLTETVARLASGARV